MKWFAHFLVLFIMTLSISLSCIGVGKSQNLLSSSTQSELPFSDVEDATDDAEKEIETEVHETLFMVFRSGITIVPKIITVEIAHSAPSFIDSYAVSIFVPPLS